MPATQSRRHQAHASMFGFFHHPDRYDWMARRTFGRLYARIAADVAAAGPADGAVVLDVGTGPGQATSRTSRHRGPGG